MMYRVFSPNSDMVKTQYFSTIEDGMRYYSENLNVLMRRPDSMNVKIQFEGPGSTLIDRATILNDLEHRCAIGVSNEAVK